MTRGYVALVDDCDFERVSAHKWNAAVQRRVDGTARVYAVRNGVRINGIQPKIRLHRFILTAPCGKVIDHINGNPLDNRRVNLRICSISENGCNRRVQGGGKSCFKGVVWNKQRGKWEAQVWSKGHRVYAGLFICEEDAARAYDAKALQLFGEFARTNFAKGADQAIVAIREYLGMGVE